VNDKISFFFVAEENSIVYKYIFLIHLSVVGHLGYFHSLAIVNSAAINMGVQVLLLQADLQSFGYIPRRGIVGTYDRSIFTEEGGIGERG
jgi:hypothetical protein